MRLHLYVQLALIFGVAVASGYPIPSFSDVNWDIVLFLTPYGIIRNHLDSRSVIRTFYSDPSSGQIALSHDAIELIALLYFAMAVNAVLCLKKFMRSKP